MIIHVRSAGNGHAARAGLERNLVRLAGPVECSGSDGYPMRSGGRLRRTRSRARDWRMFRASRRICWLRFTSGGTRTGVAATVEVSAQGGH